MAEPRHFLALYLPDGLPARALDVVRVLVDPLVRHRAHVTVRGPYRAPPLDPDDWGAVVAGEPCAIGGVAHFWSGRQSTVYLMVDAPALELAWHKPDYPEYAPHLTIYNDRERAVAARVSALLGTYPPRLGFTMAALAPLVSGDPARPYLADGLDAAPVAALLGRPLDLPALARAPSDARFALAEAVLRAARDRWSAP